MAALSFLFPDEPALTFPTRHPPAEALAKLQGAVNMQFDLFPKNGIHGRMVDDTIRLWRVRNVRNSFRPIFAGRFIQRGRDTVLEGKFESAFPAQLFAIVWVAMAALIIGTLTFVFLSDPETKPYAFAPPLLGLFFIGFGFLVARLSTWLGQSDREMITKTIRDALV